MVKIVTLEGNGFLTGKPKSEYVREIQGISLEALFRECISKLYLSMYTSRNPRCDAHWELLAIQEEFARRNEQEVYRNIENEVLGPRSGRGLW